MSTVTTSRDATSSTSGWLDQVPSYSGLLIALCAGAFSARSTQVMTLALGVAPNAAMAWLMPCLIEAGAVGATLLAERRKRAGVDALPEFLTLGALSVLAGWVQVAHTDGWGRDALRPTLALTPVAVLLVLVHLLLRSREVTSKVNAQIKAQRAKVEAAERRHAGREQARSSERFDQIDPSALSALATRTERPAPSFRSAQKEERIAQIAQWLRSGETLTRSIVMTRLAPLSESQAGKDLAEARGRVRRATVDTASREDQIESLDSRRR